MRLAIDLTGIAPGTSAGVENFSYRLVAAVARALPDDAIDLLVAVGSVPAWRQHVPERPGLAFHEVLVPATARGAIGRRPRMARLLSAVIKSAVVRRLARRWKAARRARALRRLSPDVVYLTTHLGGCPRIARVVVSVHDLRSLQPELADAQVASALEECVSGASAVVTSWRHPATQLDEHFPDRRGRHFTIPFPPMISVTDGVTAVRDRPYLLYPASTARHKNHVALLDAMALLAGRRDVELVCPGPPIEPYYSQLIDRLEVLGLNDRVSFLGFIPEDELRSLYRGAAAVVVPTLWEAASGAIQEALAYGRPIACSRIPPNEAQVESAGAPVAWFDAHDSADIARAIEAVLDRPDDFSSRAVVSRTWDDVATDYAAVFRWVAAGSPAEERPATAFTLRS